MSGGSALGPEGGEDRPLDLARYRSALRDWLANDGELLRVARQAAGDELAGDAEMVRRLHAARFRAAAGLRRLGGPEAVSCTGR